MKIPNVYLHLIVLIKFEILLAFEAHFQIKQGHCKVANSMPTNDAIWARDNIDNPPQTILYVNHIRT